ncbi:MAG: hypothetical protein AUI21_02325 [Nitrospirae bacterium 13_1_40CM_2_62_10]|nr:MAG: hypothetical protein AUI21_02325 [Nitrospirae bacterium 13_1_40CM_2_62_10]
MDLRVQRPQNRRIRDQRAASMVLNPLAEVGIGVLVSVKVCSRERVVYLERSGKRRQRQESQGEGESDCRSGIPVHGAA